MTITNGVRYSNTNPTANTVYECAPGVVLDGQNSVQMAFTGSANNVTIRNCEIKNYNVPGQKGAIQRGDSGSANWRVENNNIHHNGVRGAGIVGTQGWIIRNNNVHHNGDNGIRANENNTYGTPSGIIVENNVISFNNPDGSDQYVESGGTKFVNTRGLIVRGNTVEGNDGPGLWTDYNNSGTVYENNIVRNNHADGIFHEISGSAIIRNNRVEGNGLAECRGNPFPSCNAIHISNSSGVEITGNTVRVGPGNGIVVTQQDRDEWVTRNNWVHHNSVTCSANGLTGADTDDGTNVHSSNRFDFNTYSGCSSFRWGDGTISFAGFKSASQEASGTSN